MNSPIRTTQSSDPTFSAVAPDPFDILGILRRGWPVWLLFLILGVAAGAFVLSTMRPSYKANARLVFENSVNRYLQSNNVTVGPTLGDDNWSQIHIISSEAVLLPVIKKLNLTDDPEFGGGADRGEQAEDAIGKVKAGLKAGLNAIAQRLGIKAETPAYEKTDEAAAYKATVERLFVYWEAQPAVMRIQVESKDAVKAATIANEIAAGYINYTLESKRTSARLAAQALQNRLAELRTQAAFAERQLLEYKIANNVFSTRTPELPQNQTNSISTHIESARISMLDARARWEGVQLNNGTDSWASYIPENSLVSRLREQYIDIETRALDMESRVGPSHAASRKLRKRLAELTAVMAAERRRMASTFAVELNFAKARYAELTSALSAVMSQESANGDVTVRLRELESSAETLRALFNSLLKKASEDNKLNNDFVVLPDARILSRATPPTLTESSKKRLLVLASSSSLGLLFGIALLFARRSPLGVFRAPQQIRTALGLMPVVLHNMSRHSGSGKGSLGDLTLRLPYSRFADGVRLIWTLISSGRKERKVSVVSVVSALPGEGKTTVAINLANEVSKNANLRTLLIDADLHLRTLTQTVAADAVHGLREALDSPKRLGEFVSTIEVSGVHVLASPFSERLPNSAQVLGSKQMEELLRVATLSYDLVIIDSPPTAALTDFRMLYPVCDGFVFVVEWGKTSQRLVLETFTELPGLWERVMCVVLNKTDPGALKSIEAYKGKGYHTYLN